MTKRRKRKKYSGVRSQSRGTYEINYVCHKKRIYETVRADSESEAYAIRIQRLANMGLVKEGGFDSPEEITLDRAFDKYEESENLLKPQTIQRSRCIYGHFISFVRSSFPDLKYLYQIDEGLCSKYKNHLLNRTGKTPSGINSDLIKLRAIFSCFVKYHLISLNPFKKVPLIEKRLAVQAEKYLPSDNDVKQLWNFVEGHPDYEGLTKFLIRSGRRIEETTRYLRDDLILDGHKRPIGIRIRREITKSSSKTEHFDLDDELQMILEKELNKIQEGRHVFMNSWKQKVSQNTYRLFLKRVCEKLKIKGNITPHCFRYYVVNRLINKGINLKDAMSITGHIDVQTFLGYLRSTKEGRLNALNLTKIHD